MLGAKNTMANLKHVDEESQPVRTQASQFTVSAAFASRISVASMAFAMPGTQKPKASTCFFSIG